MKKFKAYCRTGGRVMCMGVKDGKKIPEEEVDEIPEEEIDEETLKAIEKDLKDMMEGKVETISGDEFLKWLRERMKEDKEVEK